MTHIDADYLREYLAIVEAYGDETIYGGAANQKLRELNTKFEGSLSPGVKRDKLICFESTERRRSWAESGC